MSPINEYRADWPAHRVKNYGRLTVGQTAYYSRSKLHELPDVAGEFEIVSLGPCESGVIVDMTDGASRVRCHVWVSANEHRHCSVTLRETFHIVRHAPSQREMCV
jgi:hypothetical protein